MNKTWPVEKGVKSVNCWVYTHCKCLPIPVQFPPQPLVTLTDNLPRQLDQGKLTLLFILDLTAVFNTVDYDLLAHHLASVGIHKTVIQCAHFSIIGNRGQKRERNCPYGTTYYAGCLKGQFLLQCYLTSIHTPLSQLAWSAGIGCISMPITPKYICLWAANLMPPHTIGCGFGCHVRMAKAELAAVEPQSDGSSVATIGWAVISHLLMVYHWN